MVDDMMDLSADGKRKTGLEKTIRLRHQKSCKAACQNGLRIRNPCTKISYRQVLPYNTNNIHPRFWSWVQGGGTAFGMLADMLASGMNPNVSIGNHMPMYVEKQVLDWSKEIFGFPVQCQRHPDQRCVDGQYHRAGGSKTSF